MKKARLEALLINCVNSIAYDNDMAKEQLLEIIGFTREELKELGFDWYSDDYVACIKNVTKDKFVTQEKNGVCELGSHKNRMLFYDEADAESTLAQLEENSSDCFVLIDENK